MASLFLIPPAIDAQGRYVSGAIATFYLAGATEETPRNVFYDLAQRNDAGSKVAANAAGVFPPVYLPDEDFGVSFADADGVSLGIDIPDVGSSISSGLPQILSANDLRTYTGTDSVVFRIDNDTVYRRATLGDLPALDPQAKAHVISTAQDGVVWEVDYDPKSDPYLIATQDRIGSFEGRVVGLVGTSITAAGLGSQRFKGYDTNGPFDRVISGQGGKTINLAFPGSSGTILGASLHSTNNAERALMLSYADIERYRNDSAVPATSPFKVKSVEELQRQSYSFVQAEFIARAQGGEAITDLIDGHEHNDATRAVYGTSDPVTFAVTAATAGNPTVLTVTGSVDVWHSASLSGTGSALLDDYAGQVVAIAGSQVSIDLDTTGEDLSGVNSGQLQTYDKTEYWQYKLWVQAWARYLAREIGNPIRLMMTTAPSLYSGHNTRGFAFPQERMINTNRIVRAVGGMFDIPVIDLETRLDIKPSDHLTYLPDSVHPTTETSIELFATAIRDFGAEGGPVLPLERQFNIHNRGRVDGALTFYNASTNRHEYLSEFVAGDTIKDTAITSTYLDDWTVTGSGLTVETSDPADGYSTHVVRKTGVDGGAKFVLDGGPHSTVIAKAFVKLSDPNDFSLSDEKFFVPIFGFGSPPEGNDNGVDYLYAEIVTFQGKTQSIRISSLFTDGVNEAVVKDSDEAAFTFTAGEVFSMDLEYQKSVVDETNGVAIVYINGVEIVRLEGLDFAPFDYVALFNHPVGLTQTSNVDILSLNVKVGSRKLLRVDDVLNPINVYLPEHFGAKGDDINFNDGPAIQAAIDAAIVTNGTVMLSRKVYHTEQELVQSGPCSIVGMGWGDVTDTNSGPVNPATSIRATAAMQSVILQSAGFGNRLIGAKVKDLDIHGAGFADYGILGKSCNFGEWDYLHIRNCKVYYARHDDSNGELSAGNKIDMLYMRKVGSDPALEDAGGLQLESLGSGPMSASSGQTISGVGLTQFIIGSLWCSTGDNAPGFDMGDIDSTDVKFYQGRELRLRGSNRTGGLRSARKVRFGFVAAPIYAETGAIAKIDLVNSEPSKTITMEPGASVSYTTINRNNGAQAATETFTMGRPIHLAMKDASVGVGNAAVIQTVGVQKVDAGRLPSSGAGQIAWTIIPRFDFDEGVIYRASIYYFALAGDNVNGLLTLKATEPNDRFDTADLGQVLSVPASGGNSDTLQRFDFDLTAEVDFPRGAVLTARLERNSGDTNTTPLDIIGLDLYYRNAGPREGANDGRVYNLPYLKTSDTAPT